MQFFEKYSNIEFQKNPSNGSRDAPCGQDRRMDGHDEANSRFPQFCERALQQTYLHQFAYSTVNCQLRMRHFTIFTQNMTIWNSEYIRRRPVTIIYQQC